MSELLQQIKALNNSLEILPSILMMIDQYLEDLESASAEAFEEDV